MSNLTPQEEEQILNSAPKGTMALLLVFAAMFFGAWLFMYFALFLAHGPVN